MTIHAFLFISTFICHAMLCYAILYYARLCYAVSLPDWLEM